MSSSLQPHRPQPGRLLCPWNFPGKNTRAGCHFHHQGIFPTEGSNLCLCVSCVGRRILYLRDPWETTMRKEAGMKSERHCISSPERHGLWGTLKLMRRTCCFWLWCHWLWVHQMYFFKRPWFPFDIPPTCCQWFIEISEVFLALRGDGPDRCIPFVRIHSLGARSWIFKGCG